MAQHHSQFNDRLNIYAEEYINIHIYLKNCTIPSKEEISLYITDNFFKNIFFTQLAVIKEDELFEDLTIISPLSCF